jgi:hypothetical protein
METAGITTVAAVVLPLSGPRRPNIACDCCETSVPRVIRPRFKDFPAMIRSPRAAGFDGHAAPVASSRLTNAVAASLAIGSLSLCLIVALTVLSIKVSMAMPLPA